MNNYFAAAFGRLPRWTTSWEITTSYWQTVLFAIVCPQWLVGSLAAIVA